VAAVTSTSTRAPIYKAFARRENIGDVTAKGECISNIADLVSGFYSRVAHWMRLKVQFSENSLFSLFHFW
jgi:hypothetical protein